VDQMDAHGRAARLQAEAAVGRPVVQILWPV